MHKVSQCFELILSKVWMFDSTSLKIHPLHWPNLQIRNINAITPKLLLTVAFSLAGGQNM